MSQSESLKLLNCPFCNGKATWGMEDNSHGFHIRCEDCGVTGPEWGQFDDPEVYAAWNRRTSTADRGGEVEPSEAEVEAAIVAEADAINKTHGDPGHAVQWPDDFTPDEQHCRREGMRAAIKAAARIRSALATTAGEATNTAQERLDDYRAAVAFIAADAWGGCPDCMEILQAARGLDIECEWAGDPNVIAEKLTSLRRRAALVTDKG